MFLLSGLLEKFIKNGTLRLYDASGTAAHVRRQTARTGGDAAHQPSRARRQAVPQSGTEGRGSLHGRRPDLRGRLGRLRPAAAVFGQSLRSRLAWLAEAAAPAVARAAALASGQSDRRRRQASPPSLRSVDRAVPSLSRPGHAVFLRLFPRSRTRHAGRGATLQADSCHRQAAAQAGHERGRDRLRLGRLCHSPRQANRRPRRRHQCLARTDQDRQGARVSRRRRRSGGIPRTRLSQRRRHVRSRGLGRHDGARRHRAFRRVLRQNPRAC